MRETIRVHPGLSPISVDCSFREKNTFNTFCMHTIPHIVSDVDNIFWTKDVTRASLSFPAIWHASLALGAVHLYLQVRETLKSAAAQCGSQNNYVFALTHYNIAVQQLMHLAQQDTVDRTSQEVVLMANILFTTICALLGDTKELMMHARHGLQLFYQWRLWDDGKDGPGCQIDSLLTKHSVSLLMNRMEGQFVGNGQPRPWHRTSPVRLGSNAPFRNIEDAFLELQPLMSGLTEMVRPGAAYQGAAECTRPIPYARLPYYQAIERWKTKCQDLKNRLRLEDEGGRASDLSLKLWLVRIKVMCQQDLASSGLAWDGLYGAFEEIVCYAGRMVAERAAKTKAKTGQTVAGGSLYGPSLRDALHFVAEQCRDPLLRRRALSLMATMPRRVGLWDTKLLVAMTTARIEVEEGGAALHGTPAAENCTCVRGRYVCLWHRIETAAIAEFLPDGTARLSLMTVGHVVTQQPGHSMIITW
ncbi:hypothetical protein QQS21_000959 [Conoideocrella luteorostrata]|uniref:C6 zinc finger domain protein n=1 Tax=Conoideocrella luteorostrata TaxID=1105319 RepID=A0AAJ0CY20_9HYPO|nr:hypothetical protein QQS21_000959 [Conoideocrella luteorostrata]